MAFTKTMIPLRTRESFFRDEFFSDCWDMMERQKKEFEQKCATKESLSSANKLLSSFDNSRRTEDELLQYTPGFRRNRYHHPASLMIMDSDRLARKYSSGLGMHSDRDNFKVSLDVQQFAPEELTVKTIDSTIIIEGKHEEKEEGRSLISRHFQRKYTLPADCKVEEVQCSFTGDGRLHISAPRHQPAITTASNGTATATTSSRNHESDFEKMKTERHLSSGMKQNSISDKIRDEFKQAREDFDKSTSELLTNRQERKDAFREEVKKAHEEFDKSTSSLLSRERDRDDFRHSRLLRMFEPHFTAFPEFDPLPFWKRGKTSTLLEEFDKKSSLFDEFANSGRLGKTSLLDNTSALSSSQEIQDRENFKVMLDVHEFKPEELNVKTYDYYVEIEAKHEAKEDPYGFIKREFKRKYTLPRDVKASDVQCNLSSEGILVVTAPRQNPEELSKNPHHVPIQQRQEEISSTTRTQSSAQASSHLQDQAGASTSSQKTGHEHIIPLDTAQREKTFQNTSKVHQIYTEKKEDSSTNANHHNTARHNIATDQSSTAAKESANSKPHVDLKKANGERVIPIDQESQSQSAGIRVEFPESRPESSASSIPFDFSRGRSEEPVSVASSVQPTFETLGTAAAPGERIIKIQVAN